jgi:uncharacterized protein
MTLTCPKCHGQMRTYERSGVHVDQCTECRGIFLDRGELEHLVDAENAWHAPSGAERRGSADEGRPDPRDPRGTPGQQLGSVVGEVLHQVRGQRHGGHPDQRYGYPRKKKKSFLDELFD